MNKQRCTQCKYVVKIMTTSGIYAYTCTNKGTYHKDHLFLSSHSAKELGCFEPLVIERTCNNCNGTGMIKC